MESAINLEEVNFQNSLYRIESGIDIRGVEYLLDRRQKIVERLFQERDESQKLVLEDMVKYMNEKIKRYLAL